MSRGEPWLVVKRLATGDARLAYDTIRALKEPAGASDLSVELYQGFLARPENVLIVATREERPAGFLLAYRLDRVDGARRMICLYEIEVHEAFQRQGVGRRMLETLKEHCRRIDATEIWAITHRSNRAAIGLFTHAGGKPAPEGDDVVVVFDPGSWADDRRPEPL